MAGKHGGYKISGASAARVRKGRKALRNGRVEELLCQTFRALAGPTRLRIVIALTREALRVCDVASLLGMTDSAISHQLRILKHLRLVTCTKKGKMVYYTLDDKHIETLIRIARHHINER